MDHLLEIVQNCPVSGMIIVCDGYQELQMFTFLNYDYDEAGTEYN